MFGHSWFGQQFFGDSYFGPEVIEDVGGVVEIPLLVIEPRFRGQSITSFGATANNPSYIITNSDSWNFFHEPPTERFRFAVPNDYDKLSRAALPNQLLILPQNGRLSGRRFYVLASGSISCPDSALSTDVIISLNQNYAFYSRDLGVSNKSYALARTVGSLIPGEAISWSLTVKLFGAIHKGTIFSEYTIIIDNQSHSGKLHINRSSEEPILALNLGMKFAGTSDNQTFRASAVQFDIQK